MKSTLLLFLAFGILLLGCAQQAEAPKTDTPKMDSNNQMMNKTTPPDSMMPSVKEFSLTVVHTGYTPNKITVNKGDTVRILAVTGPGQEWHGHGVTIDEYGINEVVRTTDEANPVVIQFTADQAGTFKIYCKTCNDESDGDSWKKKTGGEHPDIQATLEVK